MRALKRSRSRRNSIVAANRQLPFDQGDLLVKRMSLPVAAAIASNSLGVIAVHTIADTTTVQSTPATEWASFAARYQQFRVRSLRLILEPCFPADVESPANQSNHSALYVSDYIGSTAPGTAAQVLADERAIVIGTNRRLDYFVDWKRNPNAKLWNPTSAALPVANSFGIAFASHPTAELLASTDYFVATLEWVVELRGSQ